ncbi:Gx transporter family protein [Anaerotignum sp.]|uniref:Gx transporter family protein n=1 Tax=Anaerotignum sp. TaxID=2039241 RepID=UPI0028AD8984|nr:Gx transporter family protein [Anaerotignum sp.]
MKAKQITSIAILTTIALIIFMVEVQIPVLLPIPGVKLGLANIVTIYAMFMLTPKDTFYILILRVFLGSVFSGRIMTFLYSLTGGLLCYGMLLIMRKFVSDKYIWVCGVFGGVVHNLGQILVAIIILQTPMLFYYFPILMVTGIITGIFTGICSQMLIKAMGITSKKL